ncbi:hypothetical protein BZL41_22285 [Pseudomonas sp. PIC25]|uniref:hypothetical protein n=1 Tax=Pseudomonas sp. PIC25 TaxID=1958773 RepID=UPI000BABE76D|nr:hypothetical protein [Pseudomonas sp. PIC25]PAU54504.1 hypothetical protein BZL41_22285 [Pseudomonas sp. PIC25]
MSLSTRRRAIYTGLAGHFSEEELLPLLWLWETKYSEKPSFALNGFLAEIAALSERKLERARLYRELVGALSGPVSQLLPDPEARLQAWRRKHGVVAPKSAANATPDDQARETFEALADALFGLIDPERLPQLCQQAANNLNSLRTDAGVRLRLRSWLDQYGRLGAAGLELDHLRMLLNLIYIGLCELLGPVLADQALTRAVQQVERLGLPMSPQKLL